MLEVEYVAATLASATPMLRRMTEIISALVLGLYFLSPQLGWWTPPFNVFVSCQVVLLVGYVMLLQHGKVRIIINHLWPIVPLAFVWVYMSFYVAYLPRERAVQTQGMIIVIVMMIYVFEILNPLIGIFASVASSIFFLWLRRSLPFADDYGTQQIHAQLVIVNVLGVYISFNQCRSRRLKFYLEKELAAERHASEALLLKVFPKIIAERLKLTDSNLADSYSDVSVLFADLVGFTQLASKTAPARLVTLLDELFGQFDELADKWGVEKIKTIGDAYLAVAGCPVAQPDHAIRLTQFASGLAGVVEKFSIQQGTDFGIRVGIHSGVVIAGVIGNKRISFDLWGDTVNIASRMESLSKPGEILVSESTAELIRSEFVLSSARILEVKGKGAMPVFSVIGPR